MLQRKQSLFLLLAGLLAFSTWLFPVAEYESASGLHTLRTYGLFTADGAEVNEVALRIPFGVLLSVIGAGAPACRWLRCCRRIQIGRASCRERV